MVRLSQLIMRVKERFPHLHTNWLYSKNPKGEPWLTLMATKNNIKRKKDQLERATNRVIYWNRETDNNN